MVTYSVDMMARIFSTLHFSKTGMPVFFFFMGTEVKRYRYIVPGDNGYRYLLAGNAIVFSHGKYKVMYDPSS